MQVNQETGSIMTLPTNSTNDLQTQIQIAFLENDDKASLFFWQNQTFSLREL